MCPGYRIRKVDTADSAIVEELREMYDPEFMPLRDNTDGWWWFAYCDEQPVGFIGIRPSVYDQRDCYLHHVAVMKAHRGRGLQQAMMKLVENRAKRKGFRAVLSDTTDNIPSANNFIALNYRLIEPSQFNLPKWAYKSTLYWRKPL